VIGHVKETKLDLENALRNLYPKYQVRTHARQDQNEDFTGAQSLPGTQTHGAGEAGRWSRYLERLQRDADAVR
jgi:hypothetical protein